MLRVKDRYALYTPFYNIEEGKNPKWMCKGCSFSRVGAPSIARLHILGDSGKMCPKSRKNGFPKDALEAFMELHEEATDKSEQVKKSKSDEVHNMQYMYWQAGKLCYKQSGSFPQS